MKVLYHAPTGELGWIDEPKLAATTERHKIVLYPAGQQGMHDVLKTLDAEPASAGLIVGLFTGRLGRDTLSLLGRVVSRRQRAWLYWPAEEAIECVDRERLKSLWRQWLFVTANNRVFAPLGRVGESFSRACQAVRDVPLSRLPRWAAARLIHGRRGGGGLAGVVRESRASRIARLRRLADDVRVVPLPLTHIPSADRPIQGMGVYLRTDYWSRIESGGSYGHTCYVAKELAATTSSFICFMANRFKLLDQLDVHQVVMDAPSLSASEDEILAATTHYARLLKLPFEASSTTALRYRCAAASMEPAISTKTNTSAPRTWPSNRRR
jgi:hypothetical protein